MRTVIFEEGVAPKPFLLFSADIVDTDGENACKVVGTLNVTRYGFGIKFNKRQPHGKAMVINRDMKRPEEAIADARNYIIEKFGMTLDNEKTYKPKPSYRDFKDHTFTDDTAEEAKVAMNRYHALMAQVSSAEWFNPGRKTLQGMLDGSILVNENIEGIHKISMLGANSLINIVDNDIVVPRKFGFRCNVKGPERIVECLLDDYTVIDEAKHPDESDFNYIARAVKTVIDKYSECKADIDRVYREFRSKTLDILDVFWDTLNGAMQAVADRSPKVPALLARLTEVHYQLRQHDPMVASQCHIDEAYMLLALVEGYSGAGCERSYNPETHVLHATLDKDFRKELCTEEGQRLLYYNGDRGENGELYVQIYRDESSSLIAVRAIPNATPMGEDYFMAVKLTMPKIERVATGKKYTGLPD